MNMNGRNFQFENQEEQFDVKETKDINKSNLEEKFLIWMIDENRRTRSNSRIDYEEYILMFMKFIREKIINYFF